MACSIQAFWHKLPRIEESFFQIDTVIVSMFLALLVFSRAFGALGVMSNPGSSLNYTGDCGTMSNSVSFTTAQCSGNCYTESMKQGITPGVCDVTFVTAGCVTGSKDCASLQTEYDAMDPSAGNFGFACDECSSDGCNPTTPLAITLSALASKGMSFSFTVVSGWFCVGVICLEWM